MHKNPIKIIWGSQKLCSKYIKVFFGKICAPFFVQFLDKLDKDIGQEIPRIFLVP